MPDRRFWAYEEGDGGAPSVLRLDGPISTETWFGDEVTPEAFRAELEAHPGDIEVYINSPGGDVVAGSQIYTMLMEHKGSVTVKIEGLAASAASVVAMAGTRVLMAPTAYMMIHNAWSFAMGNSSDMRHEADVLDAVDEGIREAYHIKTGMRYSTLAQMMEDETWMSARKCVELGFADGYIGAAAPEDPDEDDGDEDEDGAKGAAMIAAMTRGRIPAVAYSGRRQMDALRRAMLQDALPDAAEAPAPAEAPEDGADTDRLKRALALLTM